MPPTQKPSNNGCPFPVDGGSPEDVAVDWLSHNIYWTDSLKDHIEVQNIKSELRRVIHKEKISDPRGIAVHPELG